MTECAKSYKLIVVGGSSPVAPKPLGTMTYTMTLGNPKYFAPKDRVTVFITREERDAINAANAARYCTTYDGDLFAEMFGE